MTGQSGVVARLAGVTHRYGATVAVDAVTLDLPVGRMVGFIGPDGVGKSSVLALIAGVRRIQTGAVTVLDGDMADPRHRAAVCPRIAYMPQGLGKNLYPTLSVFENVDFFGRLFGHGRLIDGAVAHGFARVAHVHAGDHRQRMGADGGYHRGIAARAAGTGGVSGVEAQDVGQTVVFSQQIWRDRAAGRIGRCGTAHRTHIGGPTVTECRM